MDAWLASLPLEEPSPHEELKLVCGHKGAGAERPYRRSRSRSSRSRRCARSHSSKTLVEWDTAAFAALRSELPGQPFPHWSGLARLTSWGLFVGGRPEADDVPSLQKSGISALVNLAISECQVADGAWGSKYPADFRVLALDAKDNQDYPLLALHADTVEAFIDQQRQEGRGVLVHCFAGVNRSAALCAAYLIKKDRLPLLDALRLLQQRRGEVLQNKALVRQLVRYACQEGVLAASGDNEGPTGVR